MTHHLNITVGRTQFKENKTYANLSTSALFMESLQIITLFNKQRAILAFQAIL